MAAARGAFEFAEAVTVAAKGKPGGIACRRLVRALALLRPRGVTGLRPAFVGRESALAWLRPGTYVEPFALRALGVARKDCCDSRSRYR